MALEIYNTIKEIIGPVPVELEYIYGICVIVLFCLIFYTVFYLPFKIVGDFIGS